MIQNPFKRKSVDEAPIQPGEVEPFQGPPTGQYVDVYAIADEEKIKELIEEDLELLPFRFIVNRLTRLTYMKRSDMDMIWIDTNIIVCEMKIRMKREEFERIKKKVDLLLLHVYITLLDSYEGFKFKRITEEKRYLQFGREQKEKKGGWGL